MKLFFTSRTVPKLSYPINVSGSINPISFEMSGGCFYIEDRKLFDKLVNSYNKLEFISENIEILLSYYDNIDNMIDESIHNKKFSSTTIKSFALSTL